jgi:hypothetical protein
MDDTLNQFRRRLAQINGINLDESNLFEGTVVKKKYSWGTMRTIHHGNQFSIPLHPEHQEELATLRDGEKHNFEDETKNKWTAERKGNTVRFTNSRGNLSTVTKHSDLFD